MTRLKIKNQHHSVKSKGDILSPFCVSRNVQPSRSWICSPSIENTWIQECNEHEKSSNV